MHETIRKALLGTVTEGSFMYSLLINGGAMVSGKLVSLR
jgi:hypothetical protein